MLHAGALVKRGVRSRGEESGAYLLTRGGRVWSEKLRPEAWGRLNRADAGEVLQVGSQILRRGLARDEADVVVGPEQRGERPVRAEGFRDLRGEREGVNVEQLGVAAFDRPPQPLGRPRRVGAEEQVEGRTAQAVVDAPAVNQEVRGAVAGLDLEIAVARVAAERAVPVVDADLRDEREDVSFDRVEAEDVSGDGREDARADEPENPFGAGGQLKHPVGRPQEVPGVLQTLLVVSLKELRVGPPLQHQRQLPGEVVGVLNARVHTLRPGGRVYVRGVAGEEAPARVEAADVARVDFVSREPFHVVDVQFEFGLLFDSRLDLFVQNVPLVFRELLGEDADDAEAPFAFEREEDDERLPRQRDGDGVVAEAPVDLRVGDVERALERAPLETQPEGVPDGALRAVAADQVFRLDGLRRALRGFNSRRDARLVLREAFEFGVPENVFALAP